MEPKKIISPQEAIELLQDKDYYSDLQIIDIIHKKNENDRAKFYDWLDQVQPKRDSLLFNESENIHDIVLSLLKERLESCDISYEPEGIQEQAQSYIRVKANTVFHLKEASEMLLIEGLGLLLAFSYCANLTNLYKFWFGLKLYDICKRLLTYYEELEKPNERIVFETIHKLQNQYSIVNFNALRDKSFDRVYGKISPTTESICNEISEIDNKQITDALIDLKQRNILAERNDRWYIQF